MTEALAALEAELDQRFEAVQDLPYLVFHDGFHYLEHRFWLNAVGAIALNPEVAPGASRIREIRDLLEASGAVCVFSEPQFQPRILQTIVEGTNARPAVLDPLGVDIPNGGDFYPAMMREIADAITKCLKPD